MPSVNSGVHTTTSKRLKTKNSQTSVHLIHPFYTFPKNLSIKNHSKDPVLD